METRSPASTRVAERVRAAIRAAGFTQEAFANRLGIRRGTLNRKLVARRPIRVEELVAISTALGVPPADFLTDDHEGVA